MSWLGKWVGKYLGNWLGSTASGSSGVTVSVGPLLLASALTAASVVGRAVVVVTPLDVTLSTTPASVTTGARTTSTPLDTSVTLPSASVTTSILVSVSRVDTTLTLTSPTLANGATSNPSANVLVLSLPAPTVVTITNLVATPLQVTTSLVTPSVVSAARHDASALTLALTQPASVVTGNALSTTTPSQLDIYLPQVEIVLGTIVSVLPVDVFITVVDPKVYDKDGAITYVTGLLMRTNLPEILAFSTDITTDMQVVDAMADDMVYMDGTQSVKLLRKTDNLVIDLVAGTSIPENKIYTFEHALIRQIAERDNRAVKQLRMFMQSVQNDDFPTMDTIIELPARDDVKILSGDIIEADLLGTKYDIIAVDVATLKTRWRIGARRFN